MAEVSVAGIDWLFKRIQEQGPDIIRIGVEAFVRALMGAEADALCGAPYGMPSAERVNYRNGYRVRQLDTRTGSIDLAIPKLRKGSYFPDWLVDPRRRSEQALWSVVTQCYVEGVSTRRVDDIVQTLGINGISKSQVSEMAKSLDGPVEAFRSRSLGDRPFPYVWLDAMAVKVREDKRVVNVALVVGIGVREDGTREILGVDVVTQEDGAGWSAFLKGLTARGLNGVRLVISDAHTGLKAAIASALPGASWQRCRTHFMRNLLTRVPKSQQPIVASIVRTVFDQSTAATAESRISEVVDQLRRLAPGAAQLLDEAREELLAFAVFPQEHWRKIWSNNPIERLNKEMRRRTDVVGIFPNRAAIIRLVGAILAEQNDEWAVGRRYLSLESLTKIDAPMSLKLKEMPSHREVKSKLPRAA